MSTYHELCAAIITNPDEDVPRLALADWLEQYGDESQRARAELIKCQLLLAKPCPHGYSDAHHVDCPCPSCGPAYNRQQSILVQWAERWRKGPVCENCDGSGLFGTSLGRRVEQCRVCWRSGEAGGLMRENKFHMAGVPCSDWTHKVEYVRGMKRVHATMAHCVATISAQGVGKPDKDVPSDWLMSVVRHHPDVVEVWPDDRDSYNGNTMPGCWYIHSTPFMQYHHWLPPWLLEPMRAVCPGAEWSNAGVSGWVVDIKAPACPGTILARAVVWWARKYLTDDTAFKEKIYGAGRRRDSASSQG